ncbi:flagellar biosynthetic protein FliO [Rhizobium binxianense]
MTMFDDVMGAYGSRFFIAAGAVGIALLLLIAFLWLMRNRAPSPFVRGGRNRQPRLQVLDAAAVDTRRRLVLVRRDDVEHLIMIGGPTDIVIESRILPEAEEAPAAGFRPERLAEERPPVRPRPEPVAPPAPAPAARAEPAETYEPYVPAPAPVEPLRRPEPPAVAQPTAAVSLTAERDNSLLRPQPTPERPAVTARGPVTAANILDAARQRVMPQRIEPEVSTPPAQATPTVAGGTPVVTGDGAAVQPVGETRHDFQRVLDEEMSSPLTAERFVPMPDPTPRPAPQPINPQQRREPELTPVTGADAALQKEVARIFGEMSVNRDK